MIGIIISFGNSQPSPLIAKPVLPFWPFWRFDLPTIHLINQLFSCQVGNQVGWESPKICQTQVIPRIEDNSSIHGVFSYWWAGVERAPYHRNPHSLPLKTVPLTLAFLGIMPRLLLDFSLSRSCCRYAAIFASSALCSMAAE